MVAVYNKELLSWYLITLKLREKLQNAETSKQPEQQQQQQQARLQLPCEPLQVMMVNGECRKPEEMQILQSPANPQESEWIISIKEKLERASNDDVAGSWTKICIYRIPHFLRDQGLGEEKEKAYVPQVVSIGPYHRGSQRLQSMERHKWRALHYMLKRKRQSIKLYLEEMQELEDKARACYEGPLSLTSNEFVEMLVLDGCFILEFFRGYTEGFENLGYERNDPIFAMRGMMYSIRRDMMMIENQIPLFVLDKLILLQLGDQNQKSVIADLAIIFFDPLSPIDEPLTARQMTKLKSSLHTNAVAFHPLSDQAGLHCLDVFRRSLLRKGPEAVPRHWFRKWSRRNLVADHRRTQLIHCVTDLKESGIKFKKRKTDRFWDIKFKNGVFHIPRLLVHDGTKSLFLNLVAFEQSHLDCTNDITAYVVFMDNLIDSAQDVNYLHYCGILEHWLGNDAEVADMFNHLCREVVFDINDSYLAKVSEEVNRYYDHRWNAWRASLKHKYFYNPWAVISFLAAVFLLLLTGAQTFYSVFAYYEPPN
ncbi:UPF0481 protein At3g47200-like [Chenopodium quinoa]|uniref:UPF0481 protein At3g47200-like n=1 Tax=Chenopodium quinoa TaxID=63459 RepID=UPI000B77921E|nr:UPF0481 protein At3g47200-like [Chenopodium quinoa]